LSFQRRQAVAARASARPAIGPRQASQPAPQGLALEISRVVRPPAAVAEQVQILDVGQVEREFAIGALLPRRASFGSLGTGLADLASQAQSLSDSYHAAALWSDDLLMERGWFSALQGKAVLETERAARATLLTHEERIETAGALTASFPAYGARELVGWASELDDATTALDRVLDAVSAGPAADQEVARLREGCELLRRSATDLRRDSDLVVGRAAVNLPGVPTSFVPGAPMPGVDFLTAAEDFRRQVESELPAANLTPEEQETYRERLKGAVRLEALGLLIAHRQYVLDATSRPPAALSDLANPMGELRRAADEVRTLERLRDRLVADRAVLQAAGWDVLFRRVSIDQANDVLARYGPEMADDQQRAKWVAKLEQAGTENETRYVLWQIAREFEAMRLRQIPGVDLALSRLYEAFPVLSTLSAAAVVEGRYGDDRQLAEAVGAARAQLVENIDFAIGRIAAGRINPFDLPEAVAATRAKLPAAAAAALDSAIADHQSAQFWLGMGLTAAEILVTFIPVAGPALALSLGAVQLGLRAGELADRAMLARLATSPYGDPLGVRPVSRFEWAMLGVQAALIAASAYAVYRNFRASAEAAAAAAAEREEAAAAARQLRARLNAPWTSATASEPVAGPAARTSPGAPGTATSTRPGAAGETTATSAGVGATRPPTSGPAAPPATASASRAAGAAAAQRTLVHDFQAGFLRYRFSAPARMWEALNAMPPGYAVYVVRSSSGRVIYVGITGRAGLARWGEHLAERGGEWLGQAARFEFVAVGLDTEKLALALEDDLMRQFAPQFNRQWTFKMIYRRPPLGVEIPRTNARIVLNLTHL